MSLRGHNSLTLFSAVLATEWTDSPRASRVRFLEIGLPFGEISIPAYIPRGKNLRALWYHFKYETSANFYKPDLNDNEGLRASYKRDRKRK